MSSRFEEVDATSKLWKAIAGSLLDLNVRSPNSCGDDVLSKHKVSSSDDGVKACCSGIVINRFSRNCVCVRQVNFDRLSTLPSSRKCSLRWLGVCWARWSTDESSELFESDGKNISRRLCSSLLAGWLWTNEEDVRNCCCCWFCGCCSCGWLLWWWWWLLIWLEKLSKEDKELNELCKETT